MALRKEALNEDYPERNHTMKRSRITIDVSPELRQRIKMAAIKQGQTISDYLVDILEQAVPVELAAIEVERHPVPANILEDVYRVREQVIRESKGHIFEDSAEALRQLREERANYLEEGLA